MQLVDWSTATAVGEHKSAACDAPAATDDPSNASTTTRSVQQSTLRVKLLLATATTDGVLARTENNETTTPKTN